MTDTTKTEKLTDALGKAFRMGKSTALVPNVAHMVEAEFAGLVLEQVAALSSVEAERDRLAAECEALRADAQRYRWLRSDDIEVPQGQREILVYMEPLPFRDDQRQELLTGPELDAAITAAMGGKE